MYVDKAWYLSKYPDVKNAGVDTEYHYKNYGINENRQPYKYSAVYWEDELWGTLGADNMPLECLNAILDNNADRSVERSLAAWALARWYCFKHDDLKVIALLEQWLGFNMGYPQHIGPWLLLFGVYCRGGYRIKAKKLFKKMSLKYSGNTNLVLAEANYASIFQCNQKNIKSILKRVNKLYKKHHLLPLGYTKKESTNIFNALGGQYNNRGNRVNKHLPLVSVIVPVYNAEESILVALQALLMQTWQNMEIILVDDASTDRSIEVINKFLQNNFIRVGKKIKLLRHSVNKGAYVARNTGAANAKGAFITVHDSDDFSHPQKIEQQVDVLIKNPDVKASVSHWVRCKSDLYFWRWRVEDSWIYRNVSSLMIRLNVFKTLGFWDRVRVNADTEYYHRIIKAYGQNSIMEVLPGVPLAFGRVEEKSLTQTSKTHLVTQFCGVRKNYMDAVHRWHSSTTNIDGLYLPEIPSKRPFKAPIEICVDKH